MREIKFRARHINNGNWFYGVNQSEPIEDRHTLSLSGFWGELLYGGLDPKTLGQYIGLKDSKGVEIYEGDIVQNQALVDSVIIVEGVTTLTRSGCDKFFVKQPLAVHDGLEVIGNIWENPELIK